MTEIEILEHERFIGFFEVAVADLVKRRRADPKSFRTIRSLQSKGVLANPLPSIYACAGKCSSLSVRERNVLEQLTIAAGASLVAWSNKETAANRAAVDELKEFQRETEEAGNIDKRYLK